MRAAVGTICTTYPFREGRSAPPLTTKLPDRLNGGSSLARLATPTRPGFLAPPGLVAAAAFKACTSGSPTCMGRLSNLGVRPSNAAKRAPKPEVPLLPWAKPAYQDHGRSESETRRVGGVLGSQRSPLCPFFAGRDAGEGRAKGGQQLNRAEPAALERSKKGVSRAQDQSNQKSSHRVVPWLSRWFVE